MTKIIEVTEEKQSGTLKNVTTGGNYLNDPEIAVKLNNILHRNNAGQTSILFCWLQTNQLFIKTSNTYLVHHGGWWCYWCFFIEGEVSKAAEKAIKNNIFNLILS